MSTRASSAAFNLQAKQELVKLLFGQQYYRKGPMAHRLLDHSIYSYEDLRSAYLRRVQEIHPDKHHQHVDSQNRLENQQQFIQLQQAWNRFEEIAKVMRTVDSGESKNRNFTLFGVGCSFADSEQERNLRSQFTDQACRGWFSAGALVQDAQVESSKDSASTCDPLFVQEEDDNIDNNGDDATSKAVDSTSQQRGRKQPALEFLRRSQR